MARHHDLEGILQVDDSAWEIRPGTHGVVRNAPFASRLSACSISATAAVSSYKTADCSKPTPPPILHHSPAVQSTLAARFRVPSTGVVDWTCFRFAAILAPWERSDYRVGDPRSDRPGRPWLKHRFWREKPYSLIGFSLGSRPTGVWDLLGLPWIQTPQGLGFARFSKTQPVGGVSPTGVLVFRRVSWSVRRPAHRV